MIAATLVAWINFLVLIIATLLTLYFYVKSVGPAALEQKIGPVAYKKCTKYRSISGLFMGVVTLNYILYAFFPLPIPFLPATFPWSWWVSALIAVVIAIPSGYIWVRGMRDAGEETMIIKKEHTMYGGIYQKIRHPQAVGEMPIWWVMAFLLNSPFLVLYSFVWIPIFIAMCKAEERDLLIRYGEPYAEYQKHTGFMIPRIG
jgi:protein-S-isoprenylcysteine O-methyltransferase Ste14